MAQKVYEMAFALAGKLESSFTSAFSTASKKLDQTNKQISTLNRSKANPKVQIDDKATSKVRQIETTLHSLTTKAWNVPVKALDTTKSALNGVKNTVLGLGMTAAGGFGLFAAVDKAVDAGDNVYRLATKLQITSQEAAQLNRVLKLADVDTKPFISTMIRLDKSLETAGKKGNLASKTLAEYDVKLTDGKDHLLGFNEQLGKLAEGYKKAVDVGKDEDFVTNVLGPRGTDLIPLLDEYTAYMEAASKIKGIGIDPAKAHAMKIEMMSLKMEVGQVGLTAANALMPLADRILPKVFDESVKIADYIKNHTPQIQSQLDKVGQNINGVITSIEDKFKDPEFMKLDWGSKVAVTLDDLVRKVTAWVDSKDGGKAMADLFEHVGELAAKSWFKGFTTIIKGAGKDLVNGDYGGATALGTVGWMMGGGALAKGLFKGGGWLFNLLRGGGAATAGADILDSTVLLQSLQGGGAAAGAGALPVTAGLMSAGLYGGYNFYKAGQSAQQGDTFGKWLNAYAAINPLAFGFARSREDYIDYFHSGNSAISEAGDAGIKAKVDLTSKAYDQNSQASDKLTTQFNRTVDSGGDLDLSLYSLSFASDRAANRLLNFSGFLGNSEPISRIGANAAGTRNWGGGLTWINERGGELVNLPGGSQIVPHDVSMAMAQGGGQITFAPVINLKEGSAASAQVKEALNEGFQQFKRWFDLMKGQEARVSF